MIKKIVQDIVIPKRKVELIEALHHKKPVQESMRDATRSSRSRHWWFWGLGLCLLLGLAWYGIPFFSYATVKIVAHGENVTVDDALILAKQVRAGALPLKTIKLSLEDTIKVPATTKQQVAQKASGEIVIYNAFDTKPQELVTRTRFETGDGKVYRLTQDVVVPGFTLENSKKTPGSLVATVQASLPGKDYNLGLQDFTLPAFKGTPRYSAIYARSKTPLTGGSIGEQLVASAEDTARAQATLEETLRKQLTLNATQQIPQGYLLYPEAIFINFTDTSKNSPAQSANVELSQKGTLQGILLKKAELLAFIARKKITNYRDEPISTLGLEQLTLSIQNKAALHLETADEVHLRMKGTLAISYTVDIEAFRRALAGLPKKEYVHVLGKYPAIDSAEIQFTPSWVQSFPEKPERIEVETVAFKGS